MTQTCTLLPYTFDLLYDVKTVENLHDHLTGAHRLAINATDAELVEKMIEYGIALPEGYKLAAAAPAVSPFSAPDFNAAVIAGMLIKKIGENAIAVDLPDGGQITLTLGDEYVETKFLAQDSRSLGNVCTPYSDFEPE